MKSFNKYRIVLLFFVIQLLLANCSFKQKEPKDQLFEKISNTSSKIDFSNDLSFSNTFNVFNYINFYSGGGVGLGDINNDGLLDIYLVANQKSNKLFLNKGNMQFEDITQSARVGGRKPWSTGVSIVDINGDGFLDIYVCNAGIKGGDSRKNELFINNGDLTFTESADEYGIADGGNSIHAAFFDYDNDGDLDLYLLNNYNSKPIGRYNLQNNLRDNQNYLGGDRFYLNEIISQSHNNSESSNNLPHFTDVTEEVGIFSSEIGFGLGVSVGDLNRDGWMDIYISNDFFERDYLYLNNGDGTFKEALEDKFRSISTTSMGGDIADLNNDGFPELFIADMLPDMEERLKTNSDFIGWDQYKSEVSLEYHRKFTRNTLHLNNGNGTYSEIGRYSGVEATDWSWGGLIADFNLDGLRDIFVSNGIFKDQTNKDFLIATKKNEVMQKVVSNNKIDYEKLLELIPSVPVTNYMFENKKELHFDNQATNWGLEEPSFSNGSAYGDLDNDGDLDLVINNINKEPFVYRNRTTELYPNKKWIKLNLKGQYANTTGVGAKVELIAGEQYWYVEQMPQRGYLSSVDPILHVGLAKDISMLDTVKVHWPKGNISLRTNVKSNQVLSIVENEANHRTNSSDKLKVKNNTKKKLLVDVTDQFGINWKHQESDYNDFDRFPMLYHMRSTEGPPVCTGDINNDGREDFYVGGAHEQAGALFLQEENGFELSNQKALEEDRMSEDADCLFFDANGQGYPELYVASGSSEFYSGDSSLNDRLYRFDHTGKLVRINDALPETIQGQFTGVVEASDFNKDGALDLFIGKRMDLSIFGKPVGGYILQNTGEGKFTDVTKRVAPGLQASNLKTPAITDATWGDINKDGLLDLVIVGEWMPLTIFLNDNGYFEKSNLENNGLKNTLGWWNSLKLADLDNDGDLDLVGGNHGLNSRFKATPEHPIQLWVGDFDSNGSVEHIFAKYNDGDGPYPMALWHNMIQQLLYIKSSYPSYSSYANQSVYDLFTEKQLNEAAHYKVDQLSSIVALNNGKGDFQVMSLPEPVQFSPVYGLHVMELMVDKVLLTGGNLYNVKPQAGPYDASYGSFIRINAETKDFQEVSAQISGFISKGEIRNIESLQYQGENLILVTHNNGTLQILSSQSTLED